MSDPTAGQPTVTVTRLFWVAAANAIRKCSGHATSEEQQMTDEEAWQYVVRVARGEQPIAPPPRVTPEEMSGLVEMIRRA